MNSYLQLFLKGMKQGTRSGGSLVVAFTSATPGEGVSWVTQSFAVELARRTRKQTIVANIDTLQKVDIFHYSQIAKHCCRTDIDHLYVLEEEEDEFPELIEEKQYLAPLKAGSELDQGLSNLQTLRYSFDYVLLDCPSMKESGDAALFAPSTDGVVLVVEAEKTRKEQVRTALNAIELTDAKILGCVLNKRSYPIPEWLYRRL